MLSLLLVIVAAAPTPRVPAGAEVYVFAPRLDRLEGLRSFTTLAGKKTAMLKSVIWSEELLPMLSVDVLSLESLEAAGIDPAGSITTSFPAEGTVSCVQLKSAENFIARARRFTAVPGPKWTGTIPKASYGAVLDKVGGVTAGYVQRGNTGCVIRSGKGRGGALMFEAEKLLGAPKAPASFRNMAQLAGPLFFGSSNAVGSVKGAENVLTVDARGVKLPVNTPTLAPAGPSPFANIPITGVLTVKARVDPNALTPYARTFAMQLLSYCRGCSDKSLTDIVVAFSSELTGNLYVRVDSVVMNPSLLRTPEGRYFSVRHAYFAELKDPASVKALMSKLPPIKGLTRTDQGLALQAESGVVDIRVTGSHVVISNDEAALDAALRLVLSASPGKLAHSLEGGGDPRPVGKALRKISLLDAMSNSQLAGFFAAGVEFGPLLAASEKATFWADSGNPMKAQGVWVLELPKPAPQLSGDAGSGAITP